MASSLQFVLVLSVSSLWMAQCGPVPGDERLPVNCAPGWTQFGSRCFIFYNIPTAWINAENFCNSLGGNLASIHSGEENYFLSELVKRVTGHHLFTWVGGQDAVKEGKFQWSDGSIFDHAIWSNAQPDNSGGAENCIEINYPVLSWNDRPCLTANPFLCAKPL